MEIKPTAQLSKGYFYGVLALTVLLPALSAWIESRSDTGQPVTLALVGKWFIFYAVGLRLSAAGIRQVLNPAFTAKDIFHLEDKGSYAIVRELGFANVCFGLVGILSLFFPTWRVVSAVGSGLFYGLAGFYHLIKKPVSPNETFALVTDVFIFVVLLIYLVSQF